MSESSAPAGTGSAIAPAGASIPAAEPDDVEEEPHPMELVTEKEAERHNRHWEQLEVMDASSSEGVTLSGSFMGRKKRKQEAKLKASRYPNGETCGGQVVATSRKLSRSAPVPCHCIFDQACFSKLNRTL